MKRVNNIYSKVYNLDNIRFMAHKVCLNTKNKKKVDMFETYISEEIIHIKDVLENKKYVPSHYNLFLIKEPKVRLIMSQSIRDKVINHLVAQHFLVEVFDNSFIDSSIATRKSKGTHYGLKLIKKYLNKIKIKHDKIYFLKFDIKKYFYNIDHDVMKEPLRRKIKDKEALKLLDIIIDTTNEEYINEKIKKLKDNEIRKIRDSNNIKEKDKIIKIKEVESIPLYKIGKGFSIGNMSSQIFAILYLNEMDHFIKEKLHIKYYVRYMDDGVLIHHDKYYLRYCKNEINKILKKYKLEFNENKTKINEISNGLDFLGFKFYLKEKKVVMKVRNSTKRRFKKRTKDLNKLKKLKFINEKDYEQAMASYRGHLRWGNCGNLFYENEHNKNN